MADGPVLPTDPTLQPDATVRSGEHRAKTERTWPALSVDLRTSFGGGGTSSSAAPTDLEVLGLIGEGGMGRVLLARQHSLTRDVAVKTAKPDAPASTRLAILEEGAITGRLEHPAIVPVHALGIDASGWPAMVMKRVEGVSWEALLHDPAHPGWEGWEGTAEDRLPGHLQILTQVCNALHFAHSRGVVHRDVKPANVLIGRFGDVYLADWGVATDVGTVAAQLCGTPSYLAPEMAVGGTVDARTDVYLLGATLHAVLTGHARHAGETMQAALLAARASRPFSYGPQVPDELAALCNRACHVDPAQRPQTAQEFRDALGRYLRHRDARALAEQAIHRVGELETLAATPAAGEEVQRRVERLLLEAHFGLEQSLKLDPGHTPARAAMTRLEALLESRRRRALELERDAHERDPAVGARWRTISLVLATAITLATAIVAALYPRAPGPVELAVFPTVVVGLFLFGSWVLRRRLLDTRFNRQVYLAMMTPLVLMVVGRVSGLFLDVAVHEHFVRDSYVSAGVMFLCGITLMRWTHVLVVLFVLTGLVCQAFPAQSVHVFSFATVIAMSVATVASWRLSLAPRAS